MEYFTHMTDAHEGRSIMALMDRFGHKGYACWFILLELCVAKMQKKPDEVFSDNHCRFVFSERLVREKFRLSATNVRAWCDFSATLVLLEISYVDNEFHFYIPKLLKYLDRDQRRARHVRGIAAAKTAKISIDKISKDNIIVLEDSNTSKFNFEDVYKEYPKRHGDTKKKKALDWFKNHIKDQASFDELLTGVKNYKKYCDEMSFTGTEKVKMFSTFLNGDIFKEYQQELKVEDNTNWDFLDEVRKELGIQ